MKMTRMGFLLRSAASTILACLAGVSATMGPARAQTVALGYASGNARYVEVWVDARNLASNQFIGRAVLDVEFRSGGAASSEQFAFTDAKHVELQGGQLYRRYFQHHQSAGAEISQGILHYLVSVGGDKADQASAATPEPKQVAGHALEPAAFGGMSLDAPPAADPPPAAATDLKSVDAGSSGFAGTYKMVHDGWKGDLTLTAGGGRYVGSDGKSYPVRWEAKGYAITFYVLGLGGQNEDGTGGQKFSGYLMTQTRDAMAGVTWWEARPFGFYALRTKADR